MSVAVGNRAAAGKHSTGSLSHCRVNTCARKLGIVGLSAPCAGGPMLSVLWRWLAGAAVVAAVLAGLRFELVDFLLDRFGALTDWWMRGRR